VSAKLLSTVVVMLAGCASQGDKPVGMANPASVYCQQQGGTLLIQDTPSGQVGICQLPSGEKIEEWALYRRDHPGSQK